MVAEDIRVADCGGPIAYREWPGPPGLTFVCVHSLLGSSADWSEVAAAVSALGPVLAVDLPGFGYSKLAGRSPSVATYGHVVSRFLTEVVTGPVVLMGTSLGGLVAASVAAGQPPGLEGLVLGSSYLPPYFGGWLTPAVVAGLLVEKASLVGSVLRSRLLRLALPDLPPDAFSTTALPRTGLSSPLADRWSSAARLIGEMSLLAAVPGRAERLYDRIRCPVLVLHGGEDSLVPVEWAYRAARRRPGWRVDTLPAVAHVVKAGPTDWWASNLGAWLADLGTPSGQSDADTPTASSGPRSAKKPATAPAGNGSGRG